MYMHTKRPDEFPYYCVNDYIVNLIYKLWLMYNIVYYCVLFTFIFFSYKLEYNFLGGSNILLYGIAFVRFKCLLIAVRCLLNFMIVTTSNVIEVQIIEFPHRSSLYCSDQLQALEVNKALIG